MGLFVWGGLGVVSQNIIHAADFSIPPTVPAPYTDWVIGCQTGSLYAGDCPQWVVIFYNASSVFYNGTSNVAIGTGDLPSYLYGGTDYDVSVISGAYIYYPCSTPFTGCTDLGVGAGDVAVTAQVWNAHNAADWVASSRNIRIGGGGGDILINGWCFSHCTNTTSQFISILPYRGEATTTTLVTSVAYGYISADDLAAAGGTITLTSLGHIQNPTKDINTMFTTTHISTSGYFYVYGTSTDLTAGIYDESFTLGDGNLELNWWQRILNLSYIGELFIPTAHTYAATTTLFKVGTLSPFQEQLFDQVLNANNHASSTTAPYDLTACGLFSSNFNMEICVYSLIVPSDEGKKNIVADAQAGFFSAAPFGYVTRIVEMVTASTSTSTLPLISYTFPSSFPFLGGINFHFDIFNYMTQASTLVNNEMVSNTDQKSVWQILSPVVNMIIVIFLLYRIIEDIIGISMSSNDKGKD